jgi:hypothetical protein
VRAEQPGLAQPALRYLPRSLRRGVLYLLRWAFCNSRKRPSVTVEEIGGAGIADAIFSDLRCKILDLQVVVGAEAALLYNRRDRVLLWRYFASLKVYFRTRDSNATIIARQRRPENFV